MASKYWTKCKKVEINDNTENPKKSPMAPPASDNNFKKFCNSKVCQTSTVPDGKYKTRSLSFMKLS